MTFPSLSLRGIFNEYQHPSLVDSSRLVGSVVVHDSYALMNFSWVGILPASQLSLSSNLPVARRKRGHIGNESCILNVCASYHDITASSAISDTGQ